MKIPNKISLGCFVYSILEDSDGNMPEALGEMNSILKRIRIRKNLTEQVKRETLFHEILHACFDETRLQHELEETMVCTLSPRLMEVFKRNPKLMKYILEE